MSVDIISGVSSDVLTIDPISKAARVTLYDPAGNALLRNNVFSGAAAFMVKQSTTTGAGAVVFGLHNPHASKIVHIQNIQVRCFFDGVAAATLMNYEIIKATSVTAFSAGTAITPVTKITGQSAIAVARFLDTGLTTTGITAVQVLGNILMGRVTMTATNFQSTQEIWEFSALQKLPIQLAQNEILAIRQVVASVAGDRIIGTVDWNEV